jgi:hypothetical protein
VDGADARIVSFLFCVCFKLDALALVVEWSFWVTYPAVITSKPPRPNLGPTLVAKRFAMCVGGEVRAGT